MTHLYDTFKPEHYDVALDIDKANLAFTGSVVVQGRKTGRPAKRLTFHQKDLKITSAHIIKHDKKQGDRVIELQRIVHHATYDEVRLHSDELLYPGTYTVSITFAGKITKPMNGLYPSEFLLDGEKHTLLATQFESHHAREVLPCIDEPAAKATFQLTTKTVAGEIVLSNTPIQSQHDQDNILTTTFEPTPKMSTYLLAFVCGQLAYQETTTSSGIKVRCYSTPEHVASVSFALEVAKQCLDFYEDYFGIPYPLTKCDMVALPDFASGAMENWGLITYREQTLLVDDAHTSLSNKQYVAMVVAHELAHQWFGNLVTMRWWTDLWLNEGFASWIEFLAVDHLFPEWNMWTQFITSEQQRALRLDSLEHTHAVEVAIHHPDEIRTIFDAISYSKGASLIHMLQGYLGPDDFRRGLQTYLKRHSYENTDTTDLWQALEDTSRKPVRSLMHAWTSQPGYPLLSVHVKNNQVALKQQRFRTNPDAPQSHSDDIWPVPLLHETGDATALLTTKDHTLKYQASQSFMLNKNGSGFYRTTYNTEHIQGLLQDMQQGKLDEIHKICLLNDLLESAKFGYFDTVEALRVVASIADEQSYVIWDEVSGWLSNLRTIMDDEVIRDTMKPFIRQLTAKQLKRLGWQAADNDSHFDRLLRPIVIGMAAASDDPETVKRCLELFKAIAGGEEPKSLDPDLRGVIYTTAARHGNQQTFNQLQALYKAASSSEEKNRLAAGLANFEQPALIEASLAMIQSDAVRLQDVAYWLIYHLSNRHARIACWQWVQTHWTWLETHIGTDLSFYQMPLYIARYFSSPDLKEEFCAFFEPKLNPTLERAYQQALETIDWHIRWQQQARQPVAAFFTAKDL